MNTLTSLAPQRLSTTQVRTSNVPSAPDSPALQDKVESGGGKPEVSWMQDLKQRWNEATPDTRKLARVYGGLGGVGGAVAGALAGFVLVPIGLGLATAAVVATKVERGMTGLAESAFADKTYARAFHTPIVFAAGLAGMVAGLATMAGTAALEIFCPPAVMVANVGGAVAGAGLLGLKGAKIGIVKGEEHEQSKKKAG